MKDNTAMRWIRYIVCVVMTLVIAVPCAAFPPTTWQLALGSGGNGMGCAIGADPTATDDPPTYAGYTVAQLSARIGTFTLLYYDGGPGSNGAFGFYPWCPKLPMANGTSKTWNNIYLWAQNTTLTTPYRVPFYTRTGDFNLIPFGYVGHLVLDYVPAVCQWNGDPDFWLDLGVENNLTLPTIVTADPLQGTRFHLDVYAIPEPSSLAALACGLVGVGGIAIKRRQRCR